MAGRFCITNTTITMVATLFNTALLIIIVVLYCFVDPKSNNSDNDTTNISGGTEVIETPIETPKIPIEVLPDYSKTKIDIQNLSGKSLAIGQYYVLSIKNVESGQNYQWSVDGEGVVLNNDTLTVNKAGDISIKCIDSNNFIVSQRNITAQ